MANLQKLSLLSSKLTDKAYMALRKSPHLNKLIETDLLDSKSWTGIVGFKLRDNRQNLLQDIWLSADPEESTPESQAPESSEESSGSDSEDSTEAAQANVVIHTSEESNSANENSESEQKK